MRLKVSEIKLGASQKAAEGQPQSRTLRAIRPDMNSEGLGGGELNLLLTAGDAIKGLDIKLGASQKAAEGQPQSRTLRELRHGLYWVLNGGPFVIGVESSGNRSLSVR